MVSSDFDFSTSSNLNFSGAASMHIGRGQGHLKSVSFGFCVSFAVVADHSTVIPRTS
eukprot:jgi/Psemu1/308015/fgenesh1_kg.373_\